MKFKFQLYFLLGILTVSLFINSCKKDTSGSISTLFTGNSWQLASTMRYHFVGDTTKKVDTLYTNCDSTQVFTFKTDNTCSFTNFDCQTQPKATGHWSLSADQLFLMSDVTCKTSADSTVKPFANARIVNLGQFSLILKTGSLQTYYPPNQKRVYTVYGFVRVKTP